MRLLICFSLIAIASVIFQACSEPSPELYLQQLKSRDVDERRQAAYGLLRFDKEIVLPRLLEEAQSEYGRVRVLAVQLLGRLKDERGAPVLIAALSDEVDEVAEKAAEALGELHYVAAAPALVALLEHRSIDVARQAVESLRLLRSPVALGSLLGYAEDIGSGIRREAIIALGACHARVEEPVLSDSAHRVVLRTLNDVDPQLRIAALLGAHEFGYRGGVETVVYLTQDSAPEVRHVAVQALGHIAAGTAPNAPTQVIPQKRARVIDALIAALGDSAYQSIRTKAIRALSSSGDVRALPHLELLLRQGSEVDRMEAKWALEKLRTSG